MDNTLGQRKDEVLAKQPLKNIHQARVIQQRIERLGIVVEKRDHLLPFF